MIKLYNAKITDFTKADYTNMYSLLDCAIKQKIDAKIKTEDKMRSLAGYILLYRGAKELYNKTDINITFNKNGKPICEFCFFNISHSAQRVVCVFSDNPIGVDIQKICEIKPRKEYKLFTHKESSYVNQSKQDLSFKYLEIFTKKEAAIKMQGLAIADAIKIDTFSKEFYFDTKIVDDFIITICSKI